MFLFYLIISAIAISAAIGCIWAILYLIYSRNFQISLRIFFYSFIGGLLGGIASLIISYLVGVIAEKTLPAIFFPGDVIEKLLIVLYWMFISGIIGIITGGIVGGLIGIRRLNK